MAQARDSEFLKRVAEVERARPRSSIGTKLESK